MTNPEPFRGPSVAGRVRALWKGALPLQRAFWDYAILGGFFVNLAASIGSMALLVAGFPAVLPLAVHLAPLPYNVLVLVGVWRSAARYSGPPSWANLARGAIVIWTAAVTIL